MMTKRAPHYPHTDEVNDDPAVDDVNLLGRVAHRDSRALRHLYEAHAGWIAGRLRRKLPADAVEDVLQETFLAVWHGAGNYRGSGDVGGWIWGIARLRMARWYRDRGPDDAAIGRDEGRAVHHALKHLPERQRRVVELRLAGLTGPEIATTLNMTHPAVKSAQFRAYQTMREVLTELGYAPDAPEDDHATS